MTVVLLSPFLTPMTIARAEDGQVIYDGDAREFIFEPGRLGRITKITPACNSYRHIILYFNEEYNE